MKDFILCTTADFLCNCKITILETYDHFLPVEKELYSQSSYMSVTVYAAECCRTEFILELNA